MDSLTELRDLQRQVDELKRHLRDAQKLTTIGELASSITHEFNNVLTTVINYAKMGIRHSDPAARERAFEKILAAGQRASRITTGLLSYARRGVEKKEPTDLVPLVRDILVLVEKDFEQHRVRIETQFSTDPVLALMNAGQIQQVMLNLVVNARQATNPGGVMTIGVQSERKSGHAIVTVRDSGTGIAPENMAKLFQPFFTTKQADSKGQGGNGLGLSLCKDVIEGHSGQISVQSELGKGTTFTIRLPLVSGDAPLSPAAAVMQKRAKLAGAAK